MKVNELPPIKTENSIQIQKTDDHQVRADVPSQSQGTDRVDLSAGSKDVQKIQKILEETPDVRTEKIEALKAQIARNEYQVDPLRLADKMLQNLLAEGIANT